MGDCRATVGTEEWGLDQDKGWLSVSRGRGREGLYRQQWAALSPRHHGHCWGDNPLLSSCWIKYNLRLNIAVVATQTGSSARYFASKENIFNSMCASIKLSRSKQLLLLKVGPYKTWIFHKKYSLLFLYFLWYLLFIRIKIKSWQSGGLRCFLSGSHCVSLLVALSLSPIRLAISAVAGQVTNRPAHILSSLDNSQTQWESESQASHLPGPEPASHKLDSRA